MKITIEIDGVEVASQTVSSSGSDKTQQTSPSGSPGSGGLDELYAKAAAMGALDAGRAPGSSAGSTAPAAPQAYVGGPGTAATGTADQSAGAAPGFDSHHGNP